MKYPLDRNGMAHVHADFNNRCAVCERVARRLIVDHRGTSGEVRGILCPSCNAGLAAFNDDVTLLVRAAEYLRKGPWKPTQTQDELDEMNKELARRLATQP